MAKRSLKDRLVVITGGGRGIGRAAAERFSAKGARVVLLDLDGAVAQAAAEALDASGRTAGAYALDVADAEQFRRVADQIEADWGPIDVLVNNAGIMSVGGFLEQDEAADRRQIDVNLWGVIHGMRAVLPKMKARGAGHVVNVASLAGRLGCPNLAVYSATKFAVVGITQAARSEFKGQGLDFSYVMPAPVNTELFSGARPMRWPRLLTPDMVAERIVDAVERRKLEVYVPKTGVISNILPTVLPLRVTDWIARLTGVDEMFQGVDHQDRKAYMDRVLR